MRNGRDDQDLLFRAIGNTVVAFQQLEDTLSSGLCSMMGLRDEEHKGIVSASMSFRQKVDFFAAFQRKKIDEELVPLCKTACTFFLTSEEFRNTIVHTHYSVAIGKKAQIIRWTGEKSSIRGANGVKQKKSIIKIWIIEEGAEIIRNLGWQAMTYRLIHSKTSDLKMTLERGVAALKRRPY